MARELYRYDPSLAAAVIFSVIFAASALVHSWQLVRTKNWYFIPFVVGCLGEFPHSITAEAAQYYVDIVTN